MWCSFISYSKNILCMICPMKQIMNLDSKYIDSYSKKYTYSYSFRVSVVFLIEAVWFVCMWCSFISYSKIILCMICPMKQIMNLDSKYWFLFSKKKSTYFSTKKKKKKYMDSYNTKWKKKNNWCARCKQQKKKKKQRKYIES